MVRRLSPRPAATRSTCAAAGRARSPLTPDRPTPTPPSRSAGAHGPLGFGRGRGEEHGGAHTDPEPDGACGAHASHFERWQAVERDGHRRALLTGRAIPTLAPERIVRDPYPGRPQPSAVGARGAHGATDGTVRSPTTGRGSARHVRLAADGTRATSRAPRITACRRAQRAMATAGVRDLPLSGARSGGIVIVAPAASAVKRYRPRGRRPACERVCARPRPSRGGGALGARRRPAALAPAPCGLSTAAACACACPRTAPRRRRRAASPRRCSPRSHRPGACARARR